MKELRFRGINTQTGRWVFGDSIKHTDNPGVNGTLEDIVYIGGKVPNARKQGAMKWAPVEPNTVGLFTGLLDKNGKEIYEGDILGIPDDCDFSPELVIFAEGCFMVKDDYTTIAMNEVDAEYRTIIGNIHDHPELLNET